jgi:hypothetical protein
MRSAAHFLVLCLVSCGGSEAVSAARRGDVAAVAKAIEPDYRAGRLGNDEAARIARAVAENAIESAKGDEAQTRVRELRTCARSLTSAMGDRMKTHDAAGAEAAMALLEIDELSDGAAREYLQDTSDDWRAVGARGLVRERDFEARGKALVDPSGKVRRAAMRASGQARDVKDVAMLLEAARVDPDMLARSEAVRAIARIDPPSGDTAQRLHDLWQNADDALREDIAHAYVEPNIAASGGSEELRVLLAAKHGPGVISAAAYVIMRAGPEGTKFDDETRKSAVAILVRTIDEAPRRERLLAIAMAPLSNADVRAAVKRAADETNDLESRESALSKLLEVPSEHDAAKRALMAFASPKTDEHLARRARLALAADGELAVQGWIEADLKSPDPATRLLAVSALASLHRVARAAPILADPDAHVRTSAACTVLAAR